MQFMPKVGYQRYGRPRSWMELRSPDHAAPLWGWSLHHSYSGGLIHRHRGAVDFESVCVSFCAGGACARCTAHRQGNGGSGFPEKLVGTIGTGGVALGEVDLQLGPIAIELPFH